MGEKLLLSISILASNRPDTIRRCLDSLKPIMAQIPSELILVDTSGSETLHQILLEYTDKVVNFTWCNDFSKARNTGLELAEGEWFLFLDDDEWFVEIDPLVHFFQSGEYKNYTCANYIVRNFYDKNYVNYSDSWVSRMVKRTKETCFKSKIHEYLYPAGDRCKPLAAIANHSGYVYNTPEERRKHFERNSSLLLDMIAEEPENLRWQVQLAQEYRSIKEWQTQYEFCTKCIENTRHLNGKYQNYDIGTFYAGATEALLFLERYEECISLAKEAFEDKRNSPLCHAYISLSLAVVYFKKNCVPEAERYTHQYLKLAKELPKDVVEYENQRTALLVGEAFDKVPLKRAYSILICCGLRRKDVGPMRKYLPKLEWNNKVIYCMDDMEKDLTEAFLFMPEEKVFLEAAQMMWNNNELRPRFFAQIQEAKERHPKEFIHLLRLVAKLEGDHWYPYYVKVILADEDGTADAISELLRDYFVHSPNVFMSPGEITSIANKYQVDLLGLHNAVPYETWSTQLCEYLSEVPLNDVLITETEFGCFPNQDSVRVRYLLLRVAETKVLYSAQGKGYELKHNWFAQFVNQTIQFCETYYKPEIPIHYPEFLPPYVQAGLQMKKAMLLEETDTKAALEAFKEVVDIYPDFAQPIKGYMQELLQEQDRKQRKAKEEMRQLEQAIKAQVITYIEQKQYENALTVLLELKKLKPNDLEVMELVLRARLGMLEG